MSRSAERRPGRPPRGTRSPVDPARLAAYDVLRTVRTEDAYANLVLPHVLSRLGLEGRDAALATELASGTLRMQGLYDAILARCTDRPLTKVEAKVLDLLRLGCHQLLGMRIPAHAAIATTVDLVKSKVGPGAGGFANAVLRRVAATPREEWVAGLDLATAHSHPAWVVDLLAQSLRASDGRLPGTPGSTDPTSETPELEALLDADNDRPRVTLVARPGRATTDELPGEPTAYSPFGVVLPSGSPQAVAAVRERRAGVQDEGSQLVALALAEAPLNKLGERRELWLDLCAGPGGKAALLDALADEQGAVVIANERQPHRAGLVRANGVTRVVAADGIVPPFAAGSFDRVLVDAPCTGLGALRRRPEARWRRRPEDVDVLVPLQEALVDSAIELTRPGGVIVYATCSPVLAETRGVISTVLDRRDDVRLEPVAGHAARVPDSAGPLEGTVQLWPHRHGTDAMFIALLRKA